LVVFALFWCVFWGFCADIWGWYNTDFLLFFGSFDSSGFGVYWGFVGFSGFSGIFVFGVGIIRSLVAFGVR